MWSRTQSSGDAQTELSSNWVRGEISCWGEWDVMGRLWRKQEQMEAIRALQTAGLLDQLPDKLQMTAALRLENPELTLSELAEEFDPPVSKSCLNHRLRKLLELAKAVK